MGLADGLWTAAAGNVSTAPLPGAALALTLAVVLALNAAAVWARFRNGSQGFRLIVLALAPVDPGPGVLSDGVRHRVAVEVRPRRDPLRPAGDQPAATVHDAAGEESRGDRRAARARGAGLGVTHARRIERRQRPGIPGVAGTALARYPVTSSVELYGADGALVSRFAFNLPEDLTARVAVGREHVHVGSSAEEVAPFFADERRVLPRRARALCDASGRIARVRSSCTRCSTTRTCRSSRRRTRTWSCCGPPMRSRGDGVSGRDVEFAVYGWSRTAALLLARDGLAARRRGLRADRTVARSVLGTSCSATTSRSTSTCMNDRGGIYALGFPVVSAARPSGEPGRAHGAGTAAPIGLLLAVDRRSSGSSAAAVRRRARSCARCGRASTASCSWPSWPPRSCRWRARARGRQLRRRRDAERTSSSEARPHGVRRQPRGRRGPGRAAGGATRLDVDDNLMVWVSRLIDQDVNIFAGTQLLATSERTLFASGLLPSARRPTSTARSSSAAKAAR